MARVAPALPPPANRAPGPAGLGGPRDRSGRHPGNPYDRGLGLLSPPARISL